MTSPNVNTARVAWEKATGCGTESATTTFHELYDKNDFDQRGFALGYLTMRKCTRFVQSEDGKILTGVDCSKASLNQTRRGGWGGTHSVLETT